MPVHVLTAYLNSTSGADILNATHDVKRALRESQILNGLVTVFLPGTAGGVAILENDPKVQQGVRDLAISFIPDSGETRPVRKSGSGRVEGHLRGVLLSQSVQIPVANGRLLLGAWQEVVVFDFDDKGGRREVVIHVMGEGPPEKKK